MTRQHFWKIWLRPNPLTRSVETDYMAEVSALHHTARNEDIARLIVEKGSEHSYELILSILNERDATVRDLLLSGTAVQDNNLRLKPAILGSWTGSTPAFDPKAHRVTAEATINASLRKAFSTLVGIDLLGVRAHGGAQIGLVTDLQTGLSDGTITSGGDLVIEGEKIKIDPPGSPQGVFFVASDGRVIPLDHPVVENNPKRIICRVPEEVKEGVYTLQVVTRYSSTNRILLNAPRTLTYRHPLTEGGHTVREEPE